MRIHKTLRVTPAMETDLTDTVRVWIGSWSSSRAVQTDYLRTG